MASCEKCWADATLRGVEYSELLRSREARGKACTPEQQAGPGATLCPSCRRMAVHQYVAECMACGSTAQELADALGEVTR